MKLVDSAGVVNVSPTFSNHLRPKLKQLVEITIAAIAVLRISVDKVRPAIFHLPSFAATPLSAMKSLR